MPNEIQEIFDKLDNEIVWLCATWAVYKDLFAHSDKRIDLLRESGEHFFYIIRGALLNNVIGVLNNLADPAKSGKYENCSLKQLQSLTDEQNIPQDVSRKLQDIINQLDDKCVEKSSPLRMFRDKSLNHFDLETALDKSSTPMITHETVEKCLIIIKDFMNTIKSYYDQSESAYELHKSFTFDGSNRLISVLKDGIRYSKIRDQCNKTDISNHALMDHLVDDLFGNEFKDA